MKKGTKEFRVFKNLQLAAAQHVPLSIPPNPTKSQLKILVDYPDNSTRPTFRVPSSTLRVRHKITKRTHFENRICLRIQRL